jgi:hypothetical protein
MTLLDDRAVHTETSDAPAIGTLTRDFLAWVAREPRSYAEAMEAWRSSCPASLSGRTRSPTVLSR